MEIYEDRYAHRTAFYLHKALYVDRMIELNSKGIIESMPANSGFRYCLLLVLPCQAESVSGRLSPQQQSF